MQKLLSVEELVINDSFYNYCFQNNEADILYWEEYISTYPFEKEKMEEAKQIILGLHVMLKQERNSNNETVIHELPDKGSVYNNTSSLKRIVRSIAAVAAVLIAVVALITFRDSDRSNQKPPFQAHTAANETDNISVFTTAKGEKKTIVLPDSTTLHLNAGSTLRMEKNFGSDNRTVYLSGEALFDVTHNKSLPFIVRSNGYDVKVLGTLFNVKAYPEDKNSETSLIRGKVEISMNNNSQKITLSPNQKVIISNNGGKAVLNKNNQDAVQIGEKAIMMPLSYNEDRVVIETAWAQNRLEIVNENFTEIKDKLERWYNVKIIFKDEEVVKNTFTATFEKETIDQALKALQHAYHFNYTKNDNEITISK